MGLRLGILGMGLLVCSFSATALAADVVINDDARNAVVIFEQQATFRDTFLMQARYTASDGMWAAPEVFAPEMQNYSNPLLGVAANGVAAAVFRGGGGDFGGSSPVVGGQFKIFR